MLGRNCGCSWWFEVRRDWPRVTLNKYTRTSQEGAGRLRLPPNRPWLISWQIQGDFLCALLTTAVPSHPPPAPSQSAHTPATPPNPWKVMKSGAAHGQASPGSQADGALPFLCNNTYIFNKHAQTHKYDYTRHLWPTIPACGLLQKVTEIPIFEAGVE